MPAPPPAHAQSLSSLTTSSTPATIRILVEYQNDLAGFSGSNSPDPTKAAEYKAGLRKAVDLMVNMLQKYIKASLGY